VKQPSCNFLNKRTRFHFPTQKDFHLNGRNQRPNQPTNLESPVRFAIPQPVESPAPTNQHPQKITRKPRRSIKRRRIRPRKTQIKPSLPNLTAKKTKEMRWGVEQTLTLREAEAEEACGSRRGGRGGDGICRRSGGRGEARGPDLDRVGATGDGRSGCCDA
jgi:hypothetical protein